MNKEDLMDYPKNNKKVQIGDKFLIKFCPDNWANAIILYDYPILDNKYKMGDTISRAELGLP